MRGIMQRTGGRKMSTREQAGQAEQHPRDQRNGMLRLGQSMIGPIQLQLPLPGHPAATSCWRTP